ncbi:MAG TPA: outer membrane beta-barrel protein [Gemmatimonadaceae bacterium]|uniref:Outer membrane protein beta-barrel domain-containing protein n=1 Tax=uncultured Gemmatimonadetes bacterium Rifle_16ft_4_minimus_37772 TaxID=1665097 RepID=A0A0H4T4X0_9BACT|nr:hypothetical protein [uncultured Gemmatimonadetes bacterium Rifle_16ft_4_minimus_37772]HLA90088.1 outer membrane beta-barrel protein [Gemmatimonadaceae bacterium]
MARVGRGFFLLLTGLLVTAAAQAQGRRMGMGRGMHLSAAVGANLPIGDLDRQAQTGFGIAIRSEMSESSGPWKVRGGIAFDMFSGKGAVDNYQYLSYFTLDLVHETSKTVYQYGGVGLYQSKTAVEDEARSESDFGFQGGVGVNFGKDRKTFLEFGLVDVITTGRTSVWFPVKIGIRL